MNPNKLLQYIQGESSQEEKEEIARWIDADEKNREDFLILRNVYEATLWNDIEKTEKKQPAPKKKIYYIREFSKIASVFLLALGCFHFFSPSRQKVELPPISMQTVYVPEGQRAEIMLVDGTKVWLNAKTSLTFPNLFTDNQRNVILNGEAYFDVAHDESKEFIVTASDYNIKVLGTEFNVKSYIQYNIFETALLKGSVEVYSEKTNEKIKLLPDTKIYLNNGKLVSTTLKNHDQFLWKNGIITFDNESVEDIFNKLQLYYDITIEVENKSILDHPYTGKFRTKDGIEHVLKVLQLRHKFRYTKNNETNIIIIY